jgi:predicted ATPase
MITKLELENFRGFKHLELPNLARVNVVTGPNASGKSALLEAVLLGVRGLPQALAQINDARGNIQTPSVAFGGGLMNIVSTVHIFTPESFRALWDPFFFGDNTRQTIKIRYLTSEGEELEVRMSYGTSKTNRIAVLGPNIPVIPFVIERLRNRSPKGTIHISLNAQMQLAYEAITEPLGPAAAYFSSAGTFAIQDNVLWFSQLSKKNEEASIVELLKKEFPYIQSLSVLSPTGVPAIWAGVGTQKFPLTQVSSGLHKYLSLLLGSVSYHRGVIIIDEIENGIFHDRYKQMWADLYRLAVQQENQLFVSSHSLECLRALESTIEGHESDFCLLRAGRQENGTTTIRHISGTSVMAALSGNIEVR